METNNSKEKILVMKIQYFNLEKINEFQKENLLKSVASDIKFRINQEKESLIREGQVDEVYILLEDDK